jgi:hypothetical protein
VNAYAGAGLLLWLVLAAVSALIGAAQLRRHWPALTQPSGAVLLLGGHVLVTVAVAWLFAVSGPVPPPWSWLAAGVGAVAALTCGNVLVLSIFGLADAAARPGTPRVQRTVLRGGALIGALERLTMLGTLLAGWPEGIAAIIAIKAFARYPELRAGQGTGATERFIIGTFASLGWAGVCAGLVMILL